MIRQEKQIRKTDRKKKSLITGDMIIYLENSKEATQNVTNKRTGAG